MALTPSSEGDTTSDVASSDVVGGSLSEDSSLTGWSHGAELVLVPMNEQSAAPPRASAHNLSPPREPSSPRYSPADRNDDFEIARHRQLPRRGHEIKPENGRQRSFGALTPAGPQYPTYPYNSSLPRETGSPFETQRQTGSSFESMPQTSRATAARLISLILHNQTRKALE
ncbi:hypothetical protein CONLIGDRAFT_650739 [Coniochaeta ligniaria NRRL 30616]|uniref:Uncharacterized protein n=1 Tax=Coniochaeta ligniaria NRRL 30616 TaxID=1408157 RepID=A0A1J7IX75_9PEZI|nr:hypothetical protein CONLIGDRAFT_650739 [Coniochaeta ligniaria NRRL 30616]